MLRNVKASKTLTNERQVTPVRSSRQSRPRGWLLYAGEPFRQFLNGGNPRTGLAHHRTASQ
ncbi:hypothetical protein [Scytonema sp. PCC 10023]|uniref:hypothetical protein n=1 Tax=Scytonema sp. PCC 10023 TaxID=1680591 RepID=UPI0039C68DB9